VESIASLNLLETSRLVALVKTRLNITESAPVLAQAPQTVAAPVVAAAAVEKKEQTAFKVTLAKIDAAQKAKAIKEIKGMLPGANLVEVPTTLCLSC
jgi:large subunit ribosomal protein L7/L12